MTEADSTPESRDRAAEIARKAVAALRSFLELELAGGIMLVGATVIALILVPLWTVDVVDCILNIL